MHSHELLIREVAPVFRGSMQRQQANWERLRGASQDWGAQVGRAMETAAQKYEQERKTRSGDPA